MGRQPRETCRPLTTLPGDYVVTIPPERLHIFLDPSDSLIDARSVIGRREIEKPRVSATASVQRHGRDSLSYSNTIEQQVVITHEQIMALPNLNGYWKYGDAVVPFRIEPMKLTKRTDAFIPRQTQAKVTTTLSPELAVAPPSLVSGNLCLRISGDRGALRVYAQTIAKVGPSECSRAA
jgi:hypothetical protein